MNQTKIIIIISIFVKAIIPTVIMHDNLDRLMRIFRDDMMAR